MNLFVRTTLFALIAWGLSGCSNLEQPTKDLAARQEVTLDKIEQMRKAREAAMAADQASNASRQKVDGAWVTNATTPVAIQRRPPAMDAKIELTGLRPYTVTMLAERITMLTGMPVSIAPDVHRLPIVPQPAGFSGSVEDLLSQFTGTNRLSTRFENGGVTVFRYETAVLRVKRKQGKITSQAQIGVSGSATASASGSSSAGDQSASISGSSSFDPWTELAAKVRAVLTQEGKVQEASATSSIIVTDVPEAVALARKIVDDDNKLATTAINVKIEVINVTNDDDQNLGINWNLVFNEIENANPLAAVTFSGPTLASTGSVGSFKIGVPSTSASRFANSDYLIQALNKVGKAQTLLRRDFTTIHNVPSGFSRTNSKSYRAKTTAAPASSVGGSGQVGVEPGQVTTGTRFIVTPTYLGDSEFAIEISYNDSFLRELVALGIGQQQIDAPDVDGNQIFSITTVKLGETSILNAFEIDSTKSANQGLTADTTSQLTSNKNKSRIYMLVTVTGGPRE
ncbi:hypothetical protein RQP54_18420 [Curvibacter sp. APW13]|uniref:hypothetical protein n=1 Tax=Curvibacter sp. APW13 TaxID=3077236 RepID=UPI0028DF00C7|nr:hypothetical protein [Curvibacter sp. APW13]MDT8992855.1 hypothetical protein [Curvibacter sp. APW13]